MIKRLFMIAVIVALGTVSVAHAAAGKPEELVRATTDKVVALLKKNNDVYSKNKNALYEMVDEQITPHFDMRMMSKFVLARHWRKANESQQQRFSQAFKELLVRTYATAMLKYKDEKIKVLPSAGAGDERKALVRTEFKPSDGGPTVPIHYSFYKNKEGEWKVYDMNIERISLVTNYRSAYAEKIAKDGIEALIESINKTDKQEVIGRSQ